MASMAGQPEYVGVIVIVIDFFSAETSIFLTIPRSVTDNTGISGSITVAQIAHASFVSSLISSIVFTMLSQGMRVVKIAFLQEDNQDVPYDFRPGHRIASSLWRI